MTRLLIDFLDETEKVTEQEQALVEKLLQHAAEVEEVPEESEVSVTFVTNEQIRVINHDYRGKDQATDVISFAMEEMGEDELEIIGEDIPLMLGDIIISIERAREQAEEYGHTYERELGFLAIHGLLHLLGYDHMTEEDEKKMFGKQEEILTSYGLSRA
ncbi:rRNA maturation RNase YbeY [Mangrovibacillus cuniculi]|uniref:Endoribonuclease YbeY n=1 Tax=Mangrovibacillus cuniculi TaxID=2593652 RepID=A0A7S8CBG2_9BACI|nr:rRNA maturation RNase YbeY [Mangrovibacillus cuniculi]QPC46922.1 rRNA maturation RNase YbeY [Mangrovibacillus cuniculi]